MFRVEPQPFMMREPGSALQSTTLYAISVSNVDVDADAGANTPLLRAILNSTAPLPSSPSGVARLFNGANRRDGDEAVAYHAQHGWIILRRYSEISAFRRFLQLKLPVGVCVPVLQKKPSDPAVAAQSLAQFFSDLERVVLQQPNRRALLSHDEYRLVGQFLACPRVYGSRDEASAAQREIITVPVPVCGPTPQHRELSPAWLFPRLEDVMAGMRAAAQSDPVVRARMELLGVAPSPCGTAAGMLSAVYSSAAATLKSFFPTSSTTTVPPAAQPAPAGNAPVPAENAPVPSNGNAGNTADDDDFDAAFEGVGEEDAGAGAAGVGAGAAGSAAAGSAAAAAASSHSHTQQQNALRRAPVSVADNSSVVPKMIDASRISIGGDDRVFDFCNEHAASAIALAELIRLQKQRQHVRLEMSDALARIGSILSSGNELPGAAGTVECSSALRRSATATPPTSPPPDGLQPQFVSQNRAIVEAAFIVAAVENSSSNGNDGAVSRRFAEEFERERAVVADGAAREYETVEAALDREVSQA